MDNYKTHIHTCTTCGSTKTIYLNLDEKVEDLEGCVCDRTSKPRKYSGDDLLKSYKTGN